MRFSKSFLTACSFFMCLMISNIPGVAVASQTMISTSSVVADLDRAQTEQKIQEFLNTDKVRQTLIDRGVAPDEVSSRLASLSETELRMLSGQVEEARAGGILLEILIIVLIIFLIKRM